MQLRSALRYLAYPANSASLILIAITSTLVSIGWSTPAFGYPLLVIMLTWLLKFGLVMVEHIAWQVEGKPVLSVEMLNPVEQKKSLVLLILVGVIVFGIFAARRVLGDTGGALVALVAVTLLPAAVAVQTVRDSARTGFDIREWFAVIRWLNFDYLGVVLCIALVWVLAVFLLLGPPKDVLPLFVRIALIMFGWLSVLAFLGGAILERRLANPDDTPLVRVEREISPEEIERRREHRLDSIYGEWRSGARKNAWQTLVRTVAGAEDSIDELRWLHERIARWKEPALSGQVVQELVHHFVANNRNGEAIAITREQLAMDAEFRPKTAEETLRLVRLARDGGDRPTARALLSDFPRFFPGDPLLAVAMDLSRELER
jgi:multisubunit Na+/H+ antiporter MnhB subunit